MKEILNRPELKSIAAGIRYFFADVDGTLTDGCTYYSARGEEMKKFNHIDGTGFFLLKKTGIVAGIITGENTEIVTRRAEKLQLQHCFLGIRDKLAYIKEFAQKANCNLSNIAFIGDDINDLALLKSVGLSFAPSDARQEIKTIVDICCISAGGSGAFREAVEKLLYLKFSTTDFLNLLYD
jgi:YrbI family 3-deoxy-D-manno-octulosonate 8-phosphate phosphatase